MTGRTSVIGMLVYRDSTSKDTMISSGSMVCCRMNCEKSLEFLQCCWLSLVYGLSMPGALNEELLETSYNEIQIYQDCGSLLVFA